MNIYTKTKKLPVLTGFRLLVATVTVGVFISIITIGALFYPEASALYLHPIWVCILEAFHLSGLHASYGQLLLGQLLAFFLLEVFLIMVAAILYTSTRAGVGDRNKPIKSESGSTAYFMLDLLWGIYIICCSCYALVMLLITDPGIGLIHRSATGGSQLLLLQMVCLFIGACGMVCLANWDFKKHFDLRYLSTLQAVALVLTDIPLYIAGCMGLPVWSSSILAVNLAVTLIVPLLFIALSRCWPGWCQMAHQTTVINRLRYWLVGFNQDLPALRYFCLLRFLAVSKVIAWCTSNTFATNGAFPEALQTSMGALAVACVLACAWCYLSAQLIVVTLLLEKHKPIEYCLPFEGWVFFILLARDQLTALVLSFARFYQQSEQYAIAKINKLNLSPMVSKVLLVMITPVRTNTCLVLCFCWPLFGLDEQWLVVRGLKAYLGVTQTVYVKYMTGGTSKLGAAVYRGLGLAGATISVPFIFDAGVAIFKQCNLSEVIVTEAGTCNQNSQLAAETKDPQLIHEAKAALHQADLLNRMPHSADRAAEATKLVKMNITLAAKLESVGLESAGQVAGIQRPNQK